MAERRERGIAIADGYDEERKEGERLSTFVLGMTGKGGKKRGAIGTVKNPPQHKKKKKRKRVCRR